ncbi:hypothetical protein TWF506_000080 [Arthrobotrys conoides]|uniref:F-box domain-containing protein n=1 Tax=Arthrobotrys conoides TaxID=74498 RepID=A0AAN8NV64_9PEZI
MAAFARLPAEIHIQILSYLDWQNKYRCSLASKKWQSVLFTHGQDVRLADSRDYEESIGEMDEQEGFRWGPRRPGYHPLFQGTLICYMELDFYGNIKAMAFGPRIRAQTKPIKLSSPTMQYPIITGLGRCFLLNDQIFERIPELPDDGTGDPRRISLEMSLGDNHNRRYVQNKVWLFSEETRLDKMTIKEFIGLVMENLREHDPLKYSRNTRRVTVRIRRSHRYLITVYAELFEIPGPKLKTRIFANLIALGRRSRSVC